MQRAAKKQLKEESPKDVRLSLSGSVNKIPKKIARLIRILASLCYDFDSSAGELQQSVRLCIFFASLRLASSRYSNILVVSALVLSTRIICYFIIIAVVIIIHKFEEKCYNNTMQQDFN